MTTVEENITTPMHTEAEPNQCYVEKNRFTLNLATMISL